ncbi:ATP-binding response regulator [Candidatus Magnetominusculus xianensis]|uniref:Transcriptional regulator n=1 Tax=Candidatus Magnetominusculus xianensis TaxID=1748249 RepID=A0ABR5SHN9_9BACT|nr:response regulator [Candidatus Magnetominusculus xianensis]KWT83476.1 putative transcriptional regulator [Candidatus Magnetominusculus xianensis]MBF0404116.1 response regulator [Nitrospirota bacterium]
MIDDNDSSARILVVEDESIVAMSIKDRLIELGFTVTAIVSTGEAAIKHVEEAVPDLILMDVVLKGELDGIRTASIIHNRFDVPIIYLTAFSDDATLSRAKHTTPYGYILKPFEGRELLINIEFALYKHNMQKKLRKSEQWLVAILKLMSAAVITTDVDGTVMFMNNGAAAITGWDAAKAIGEELRVVFDVTPNNPLRKAIDEGMAIGTDCVLTTKTGLKRPVGFSSIAISDDQKKNIGVVVVIHNAADKDS